MSADGVIDVVIVGAGAAGLAAARRLRKAPVSVRMLEARARLGGRAVTVSPRTDLALDLGCGWLHSADRNPLAGLAIDLGFSVNRTPPGWDPAPAGDVPQRAARRAFGVALQRFEERLQHAADTGPDRPASDLFDPSESLNPVLDLFSTLYNGVEFDQVSVWDYAAYDDSGVNWRVDEGYGRVVAALGADSPVVFGAPVTLVDHAGPDLRLETPTGALRARSAIITVPASVIAAERIGFRPALPDKVDAANGLPLGVTNKAFLALESPESFPEDCHLFGRYDTSATASYHVRPLGRPYVEVFAGGRQAQALERDGAGALAAFAEEELVQLLGTQVRKKLTRLEETAWGRDPFAGGSYSHARPGHAGDRARLAAPVDDRLFFAGEACSAHAFSTAHGAYETGVAAAEQTLAALARR